MRTTDEFPCESVDNDWRGLLAAHQLDTMEWPPGPEPTDSWGSPAPTE